MPEKITRWKLLEAGVCEDVVERFEKIFGEEVEVTEDLADEYAQKFPFECGGSLLKNPRAFNEAVDQRKRQMYVETSECYSKYIDAVHAHEEEFIEKIRACENQERREECIREWTKFLAPYRMERDEGLRHALYTFRYDVAQLWARAFRED